MPKKQLQSAPDLTSAASSAAAKPAPKSSAKSSSTPRVTAAKHSRSKATKSEADNEVSDALALDAVGVNTGTQNVLPSVDAVPVQQDTLAAAVADFASPHAKEAASPILAETKVSPAENPHEAISRIAYGYYIARGYAPGNPDEDWARAEREYYSRA